MLCALPMVRIDALFEETSPTEFSLVTWLDGGEAVRVQGQMMDGIDSPCGGELSMAFKGGRRMRMAH